MHKPSAETYSMTQRRVLIVRGDLRSQTGWSRATRALLSLLRPHFGSMFGIDLHFSPSRSFLPASCRLIGERDIDLLVDTGSQLTLLNMCMPHECRHVPQAHNIGYFFWETDKPPVDWGWIDLCSVMDQLWVPTDWQRQVVASWLPRSDIRVIPWPHEIPDDHASAAAPSLRLNVHRTLTSTELLAVETLEGTVEARGRLPLIGARAAEGGRKRYEKKVLTETACTLNLARLPGPLVFAVQTDVPRKGLPILISEWLQFRRSHPDAVLLLKFSSIDVTKSTVTLHSWLSRLVNSARSRIGAHDDGIYVCYEHLDDVSLAACYRAALAFISATYGEGFGGPIVESVLAGTLPVVPTHSACAALLPDGYPFGVETKPVVGRLVDELRIYPPSAQWHVPTDGAIARRLSQLFATDPGMRTHWLQACRRHLRASLSPEVLAPRIADALMAPERIS
jgi:glycosyltransferase involved in cell wall biosynthesis